MVSKSEVVIITGANTGLGYELAKVLSQEPDSRSIVLTSRSLGRVEEAIRTLKQLEGYNQNCSLNPHVLEQSDPNSVDHFSVQIKKDFDVVDCLVHNGAVALDASLPAVEDTSSAAVLKRAELFQQTMAINVVGPDLLTTSLLPQLIKSTNPRLIFLSSGLGSLALQADLDSPFSKVNAHMYRVSKAAINMLMLHWHKQLKEKGVKVYGICPGFNVTGLGGSDVGKAEAGATDPSVGGQVMADVVLGKRKGEEGLVVGGDNAVRPW